MKGAVNVMDGCYRIDTVEALARNWQAQGATVFTNGCFDLLHVGHLRYLQASRALGDRLVVGLNSDASVRGLKGPDRPLVTELERAEMLLGLECVDAVVIFDEPTAERVIRAVRPRFYAKGGDYRPETLPETPAVVEGGGEVIILPFVEGRSTSALVARMQHPGQPG